MHRSGGGLPNRGGVAKASWRGVRHGACESTLLFRHRTGQTPFGLYPNPSVRNLNFKLFFFSHGPEKYLFYLPLYALSTTYTDVRLRMLTYADAWLRMLTYARG